MIIKFILSDSAKAGKKAEGRSGAAVGERRNLMKEVTEDKWRFDSSRGFDSSRKGDRNEVINYGARED